ncbi:MAG TPA: HAMP domain-containing methyl-accepting chemotaxis protein [Ktedonobacteraceae bacterium]|nr:HAMP domain-containing methyl-accepting chemotaxis protein [Ktedonobacteraceae bacterium]
MNPDRNRSGMSVNTLIQIMIIVSAIVPFLGFVALIFVLPNVLNIGLSSTLVGPIIIGALIVLVIVVFVNYMMQKRIKDRIYALVDVCRDYAGGDRSIRAVVSGDDEFANLSMALNTLLDNQGLIQSGSSISSASGSDAAALQAQIEKLLQEVSAVGDGDLRVQAEVTPDTLGVLADSFNYMIEELAKVVGRVQTTAVQVTNATRRILDRSAELASASETQVAQISQTTEAVEALAIFIQNVARNAQMSAEAAQDALRNANSGQQAVRQTIEGMVLIRENVQETSKKIKRLGERSNEIGEIVRIIEDIADQTNLLALNAAIQSAMAGEHGRGFAVVADEIRLLAERSTESTKRIATLVKSIQGDTYEAVVAMEDSTQEVVKGSQLADEAGRSLNSIYSAVERQAQMIESIARAANEQASVSEAVAVAMSQISEITRQTNAATQEGATSVSYLAELSDQLRASVSTFRLPDRGEDNSNLLSGVPALPALTSGNQDMNFPQLGSGMDNGWGQNFSGASFPPLPEPDNGESLVALAPQNGSSQFQGAGQFSFNNQDSFPGFDSQAGYSNGHNDPQQGFGNQQGFGGQQGFGNQQGFGGQQGFGNQQGFGSQSGSNFNQGNQGNSQQGYGDMGGFDNQSGFGGQQQGFGSQQGFNGVNQPYPPFGQNPPQQSGFGAPPQNAPAPPPASRQPWLQNGQNHQSQNHQSQNPFGPDQSPFSNDGQFGQ